MIDAVLWVGLVSWAVVLVFRVLNRRPPTIRLWVYRCWRALQDLMKPPVGEYVALIGLVALAVVIFVMSEVA